MTTARRPRQGKQTVGTDLRKEKVGRQWCVNHFDGLDGEGPGSDIEPPNFLTWGNRRTAHMGPEFS